MDDVSPPHKSTGFAITVPETSRRAILSTVGVLVLLAGAGFGWWLIQSRAFSAPKAQAATRANASAEQEARIRRDIFFSNFAEARLPDFGAANLSDVDKAQFAIWHALINSPEQIQTEADRRYVSAEWVAKISEKYLGTPPAGTAPSYLPPGVASVANIPFARVESWKSVNGDKNDRYSATVRVYEPPAGWKTDPYTWTMPENLAPDEPRLLGRWGATVRRIPGGYDPPFRYVLTSWSRLDHAPEK